MSQSFILPVTSYYHFYLWYNLQLNCSIQFSATILFPESSKIFRSSRNWGPDLPPMVPKGNGSSGRVPPSAVATEFHQSDASRGTWCGKHHLSVQDLEGGSSWPSFCLPFLWKRVDHREFLEAVCYKNFLLRHTRSNDKSSRGTTNPSLRACTH